MVEGIVATDPRLTGPQASCEQRPKPQQLGSRVIAWVSTGHRGEAFGDQFEAGPLRCVECFGETRTGLIANNAVSVPAQLIRCEPVISRTRVKPARGDVGVQSRSDRRFEVKAAVRSGLVGNRWREAHVVLLAEHHDRATERAAQLLQHQGERVADLHLIALACGLEVLA